MKEWVSPIPKKVHLIWIGNLDFPDYFQSFLKTFNQYMPEFEIKVWRNKDLTKKNFPKTINYIRKSIKLPNDICEFYEIVSLIMSPI